MPPIDDVELIGRSRRGDQDAFCLLVERHEHLVRTYIARQGVREVFDVAQEVFIQVFENLESYRGESAFPTWLIGVARNCCKQHFRANDRRARRQAHAAEDFLQEQRLRALDLDLAECAEDDLALLRGCLAKLAAEDARLHHLVVERYFKDRSVGELAESDGRPEGALRMTLLRVREALFRCILAARRLGQEAAHAG